MQLTEIFRSIVCRKFDNIRPCFNPHDVTFVTNKWDTIEYNAEGRDENNSDEDDVATTWEAIKTTIKIYWPFVKEENIYRMSLKDVSRNKICF